MAHVGPIGPTEKVGRLLDWRASSQELELPTWLVALAIYGGWLGLTWYAGELPWIATVLAGGGLIAWHNSLQHEVVHGHPTPSRACNAALGLPPLGLWMPYLSYARLHLSHHQTNHLTQPDSDTESFYFTARRWSELPKPIRLLFTFNNTLLGRLTVGPAIVVVRFWYGVIRALAHDRARVLREWTGHLLLTIGLLLWVVVVCAIPLWLYLIACYVGLALTLLRSFTEHRPADNHDSCTAIVEAGWFWQWLFLANNLHALHHRSPSLAWYRFAEVYQNDREILVRNNQSFVFRGYSDVFRRYILTVKDTPLHPSTVAIESRPTTP